MVRRMLGLISAQTGSVELNSSCLCSPLKLWGRPQTPVKVEKKNWFDALKLWGLNQCWERTGSSGKRREQCTNQPASRGLRSAEFPGLKAKNQACQQQNKCRFFCRFGTSDTVEVWKMWKTVKMENMGTIAA